MEDGSTAQMELCLRCATFLLTLHYRQISGISGSSEVRGSLVRLRVGLRRRLSEMKVVMGFNHVACRVVQRLAQEANVVI